MTVKQIAAIYDDDLRLIIFYLEISGPFVFLFNLFLASRGKTAPAPAAFSPEMPPAPVPRGGTPWRAQRCCCVST